MTKVVVNQKFGGFSLSDKAVEFLKQNGAPEEFCCRYPEIPRHHPLLVKCVECLGNEANGAYACLVVVEIPDNRYRITEYDGFETVEFPDSINWIIV